MRRYDFSPLFSNTIGFDRMQRLLDAASERSETSNSYPPYNIEAVEDNAYRITLAVAGFSEKDLDITVKENALTVSGKIERDGETVAFLHQGIAGRAFERRFSLADYVVVSGANLENGMLYIDLAREVPEALKPRKIDIKHGGVASLTDKAKKLIGGDDKAAA
ncbi:MAG: heat-shock protein [Rhodospirillaceae bacterium]|jgi:molecular chaperone IbpA|nr:heat-shock protein [Rhodospirillaceae bacterium]